MAETPIGETLWIVRVKRSNKLPTYRVFKYLGSAIKYRDRVLQGGGRYLVSADARQFDWKR